MRRKPRKLTPEKKEEILKLRGEGLGYQRIGKAVGLSKSTVIRFLKQAPAVEPPGPIAARILKPFPNPRIMAIYFGERKEEKYGKVVVKPFLNYPPNSKINVLPVEGEDGLFRIA